MSTSTATKPTGCRIPARTKRIPHVSNHQRSIGSEPLPQRGFIHRIIARLPMVRVIAIVPGQLRKAGTRVEPVNRNLDSGFRFHCRRHIAEGQQSVSTGNSELENGDFADSFLLRLICRCLSHVL